MQEYINRYIEFALSLSTQEVELVAVAAFILLLIILTKWFGKAGFLTVVIIGFIGYALYQADIYEKYLLKIQNNTSHDAEIQKQIDIIDGKVK